MAVPIPATNDLARLATLPHAISRRLAEQLGKFVLQILGVRRDRFLIILDLLVPRLGLGFVLGVFRTDRDRITLVGEHQGERGGLALLGKESARVRPTLQDAVIVLGVETIARVVGRLRLLRPVQTLGDRLGVIVPEVRVGEQLEADGFVDLLDRHIGRRQTRRQETEQ